MKYLKDVLSMAAILTVITVLYGGPLLLSIVVYTVISVFTVPVIYAMGKLDTFLASQIK